MKKINKIFASILILSGLYYLIKFSIAKELTRILVCLCVPILVILPKFIKKYINDKLVCIYYFYIFILMILGCLARFYSIYKYYDVFAHFMFGFVGCIVALYLLNYFKIENKSIILNIIIIISVTLALASIWEIFEYFSSIIFKDDVQNVLKTGVSDTMQDIIASLVASIIFVITYIFKRNRLNEIVKCQK